MKVPVNIGRFRRQRARARLPFAVTPGLRVAQVTAGNPFERGETFPVERWHELQTYRPRVLIGSAADLHQLRERVEQGTADLTSVDDALFVPTVWGDRPISDVSRVMLWQTFGVPVYELFVGKGGTVIASECEAQEGWHIAQDATFSVTAGELSVSAPGQSAAHTGLTGHIEAVA